MILKIHKGDRTIIALVDSNLLGKIFEEKNHFLDLSSNFYNGIEVNGEKAILAINSGDILNLVGEESVALGIKLGHISEDNVLKIKDVPYAQATLY
jgi:hypothetical protein